MDRRSLLQLMAAATLAGCDQSQTNSKDKAAGKLRVVVAGAGIVGASIAYHLTKAGAQVTVIDKEAPASHASRGTFAWINATWAKQPRDYHRLNQTGVANWGELQQELNLSIRWGGSLEWFNSSERQVKLAQQIVEQAEWGEPARMVTLKELQTLEPKVNFAGADLAAFSENDGAIDPVVATQRLLRAAENLGASVQFPCELLAANRNDSKLESVTTSLGTIKADRLVLASGAEPNMAKRFAGIDIPQRSTPGVIAITRPTDRLLNRIIVAPGIHMHQRDDGRIVLGEQSGAPQNEAHAMRLEGRPNQFPAPELAAQHAGRMLDIAKLFLPDITDQIEQVYIGWRPLPLDGHPVLGASSVHPDVYLAIMHSGVSLAPIVGQLAALEITEQRSLEQLQQYRPDREFQRVKRY